MSDSTTIAPDELRMITEVIRARVRHWSDDVIEIGKDLSTVKGQLPHGDFQDWVEGQLGMTIRTAQNYMSAAKLVEAKGETISLLPPATIYLLASKATPDEITDRVVAALEAGNTINPRLIHDEVAAARADAQAAAFTEMRRDARSPEAKRRAERRREEQEREFDAARQKIEAAAQEAATIICRNLDDGELDQLYKILPDTTTHELRTAIAEGRSRRAP